MFELLYNFHGLNQEIFLWINRITNHFSIIAYILQIISYCFNITNFAIVYFIYCGYFYIQLKKIQDFNQRQIKFWSIYNKMVMIGIIYAIFGCTYALFKFSVNIPRPFCSLPLNSFVTIAHVEVERCLSSFPSSHSGLALMVSYCIWPYITMWQKIIAFLIVLLVAVSRITLAMHYPADIIYSFLITIMIIVVSKMIFKIFTNNLIKWFGERILSLLYHYFLDH
ncbi:phosphatase PAP2 family protein [Candidatus Tisiphia endosymbiont of Dascillus cervinus]|uniref:phosphatase PAP2 family protein n=1 Tax=Candidatus Tisiphia endosymbiont of Dascillus cervinus TaxID=3066253 RepID=UPI00312C906E